MLFYVLFVCKCVLPPGDNPNAVNKYIIYKVKQSLYRPGQALSVPGVWGPQISRKSAHEGVKVVSPTWQPSLPLEIFLVRMSVRGCVDSREIARPECLRRWKTLTQSGIERANFRLVAQCLNQLRHSAPQPLYIINIFPRVIHLGTHLDLIQGPWRWR